MSESLQSLSPAIYTAHQKGTYPNFRQRPICPILRIKTNSTLQYWITGAASIDILKRSKLNLKLKNKLHCI